MYIAICKYYLKWTWEQASDVQNALLILGNTVIFTTVMPRNFFSLETVPPCRKVWEPLIVGIQPAEIRHNGATLFLACSALELQHLLH